MTEIKMKAKLTPEQSQRLIELGVSPSNASECVEVPCGNMICHEKIFNIADILSLLPKEIPASEQNGYFILVCPLSMEWDIRNKVWVVRYKNMTHFIAPELIDALFELLYLTLTRSKNEKRE